MKISLPTALLSVIATSACGPVESFPPRVDAGQPTTGAGETCDGVCLELEDSEWLGPHLVWMGDEDAAPACPKNAPVKSFTGHGYLDGPLPCNACSCDYLTHLCYPPKKVTAAASSCAGDGPGVTHTSFDPLTSWMTDCTDANAIPAGQLCGGVPCVQSVTIVPSAATPPGCLPSVSTMGPPPPPWNRFVQGCFAAPFPRCNDREVCYPASPGPEFKQCIYRQAHPDLECPAAYPNKSFFYQLFAPMCSPCACESPCTRRIDLYQDGSCGTSLGPRISIDATSPGCVDVPPGSALGSMSVSESFYKGGTCTPSGGAPEGRVFCCMP
ncbi:MAG: hypothetical protein ACMG6S_02640 [Byssovorax sp.]